MARTLTRIVAAAALITSLLPAAAFAQTSNACASGESPRYVLGFANLEDHVGAAMGAPLTCEFPDPNGTGDVHQQTTRGLAFWRKSTNTPTFTNGWQHWGRTSLGWVEWTGSSIDPPGSAVAGTAPAIVPSTAPVVTAAPTPNPAPPATYSTANGLKTESQLRDELSAAGYGGPWDTSSLLTAYQRATATPLPVLTGVVVVQQSTDEAGGYIDVESNLDPRKHYVLRVTSVPSGIPLTLTDATRKDMRITTPYEEAIQFSESDKRNGYVSFPNYVLISKGGLTENASITGQFVDLGGASSEAKTASPSASSSTAPLVSSTAAPAPASPASERATAPTAPAPPATTSQATPPPHVDTLPSSPISSSGSDGCGSRGGPGYRLHSGKCASWEDAAHGRT